MSVGAQIATASIAGSAIRRSVSSTGTPSARPTSSARGITASETAASLAPGTRAAKQFGVHPADPSGTDHPDPDEITSSRRRGAPYCSRLARLRRAATPRR